MSSGVTEGRSLKIVTFLRTGTTVVNRLGLRLLLKDWIFEYIIDLKCRQGILIIEENCVIKIAYRTAWPKIINISNCIEDFYFKRQTTQLTHES